MSFEQKYLKYKEKYLKLKELEGGLWKLPAVSILAKTPEKLVEASRTKFTNAKLAVPLAEAALANAKELQKQAEKDSKHLSEEKKIVLKSKHQHKVAEATKALEKARAEVNTSHLAYQNAKKSARESKITAAKNKIKDLESKLLSDNSSLKLAKEELAKFEKEEKERLTHKSPSSSATSSPSSSPKARSD